MSDNIQGADWFRTAADLSPVRNIRSNRYLEAAKRIPKGETRAFMELAAMAARPGAARAAGRAIGACQVGSDVPWHRVVASDGSFSKDPIRAAEQLERLRREGARPRGGESIDAWVQRTRAAFVGKLPERVFAPAGDERVKGWPPMQVEPIADKAAALARGFGPLDRPPSQTLPGSGRRRRRSPRKPGKSIARRVEDIDWNQSLSDLASRGFFHVRSLLAPSECDDCLEEARRPGRFERTIEMLPRGYGVGSYHYWKEPIPEPVHELRGLLYGRLRPLAGEFRSAARETFRYPPTLEGFWRRCHAARQSRASSILLCYGPGGVNHPHRDIYGKVWFPFQALLVLSRAGRDFEGGEFVLIEERPDGGDLRLEVAVSEGDLVVFCSQVRWEAKGRRRRKVSLRHAMNPVTRGERYGIGLVFHLAQ